MHQEGTADPRSDAGQSAAGSADRRRHPRYPDVLRVRFRDLEGAGPSRWGESRDLSLGGLRLFCDASIDVGTHLALEIHTDAQPPVVALARVLRCRSEAGGFAAGLQFLWVGEEDQRNLAALAEFFRIHHGA